MFFSKDNNSQSISAGMGSALKNDHPASFKKPSGNFEALQNQLKGITKTRIALEEFEAFKEKMAKRILMTNDKKLQLDANQILKKIVLEISEIEMSADGLDGRSDQQVCESIEKKIQSAEQEIDKILGQYIEKRTYNNASIESSIPKKNNGADKVDEIIQNLQK